MRDSKFIEAYLKIINEGADDVAPEMNDEQGGDEAAEQAAPLKKVTFLTSDEALINALNSGFEEVVFFVKSENDEGEESVEEVKIGADSFGSVEVTDAEEDGEKAAEDGEEAAEDGEEVAEDGEEVAEDGEEVAEDDEVAEDGEEVAEDGEEVAEDDEVAEDGEEVAEDEEAAEDGEEAAEDGEEVAECGDCCDPSEWVEDGVCLKCGSSECDGTCKGSKEFQKMSAEEDGVEECGDGAMEDDEVAEDDDVATEDDGEVTECGDGEATEDDDQVNESISKKTFFKNRKHR